MYTEGDVVSFIESEGRWSGRIQIGVVMAHENGFHYVVKFGDLLSREKHRVDDIHRKIADISDPIDLIIKKWNNYVDQLIFNQPEFMDFSVFKIDEDSVFVKKIKGDI